MLQNSICLLACVAGGLHRVTTKRRGVGEIWQQKDLCKISPAPLPFVATLWRPPAMQAICLSTVHVCQNKKCHHCYKVVCPLWFLTMLVCFEYCHLITYQLLDFSKYKQQMHQQNPVTYLHELSEGSLASVWELGPDILVLRYFGQHMVGNCIWEMA